MNENATSLVQNITSAKAFQLIEGRGSYRLTDIAKHYFFPTTDNEKKLAVLQMVRSPSIYEALIERFDGQKIPVDMLPNILHRDHRVSKSWQPRVAGLFLSAMREAELIDARGFLRYKSSLHSARAGTMSPMRESQPETLSPVVPESVEPVRSSPTRSAAIRDDVTVWDFRGIHLEAPETMTMDLWKKLSDYVNVLKPDEDSGE